MNREEIQSIETTAEMMCVFYEKCMVKTGCNKDLSLKLTEIRRIK